MRITLGAVALAAALLGSAPAFADSEARTAGVRYGDLNLASSDGQRALDRRIVTAARRVCGVDHTRNLPSAMRQRQCLRAAIADAKPAVGVAVADATRKTAVADTADQQ